MRTFETGATRDSDDTKIDYEGYLSPLVLRRYGEYMRKNSIQADGKKRESDNWQKGIDLAAYAKSLWRHFVDFWTIHRRRLTSEITSYGEQEELEEALCAVLFNASGYLHEILRKPLLLQPACEQPMSHYESATVHVTPPPPSYGWDQ